MTDEIFIPEEALLHKPWWTQRPNEERIKEILAFIGTTAKPHLWPGQTYNRPDGDTLIDYLAIFELPASKPLAPCPCCTPRHGKYRHGVIAYFPNECTIRIMGHNCFESINSEKHVEALTLRNKLLLYRFRRRPQVRLDVSQMIPGLEPRLNQILLPLLSVTTDPVRRLELRVAAAEAQGKLIADRGLNVEAHVLEALADLMDKSTRAAVPVSDVTRAVIERFGNEYERPVTNRWVGGILRKRLSIRTYKSHGVYVVPMTELLSIEVLCSRYGIYTLRELGTDIGDVGTRGTSEGTPEAED